MVRAPAAGTPPGHAITGDDTRPTGKSSLWTRQMFAS
jgi:hypothetical protein